jgi:hypothetical protein
MNRYEAIAGVLSTGLREFARYPPQGEGLDSLPARARAHKEGVGRFQVDYDFRFTDHITRSGITFVNRPVDDAACSTRQTSTIMGTGSPPRMSTVIA